MVEAEAGDDFGDDTLLFLDEIKSNDGMMLAVCTAQYAEMTASKFSSYVELKYCFANGVQVLPLRTLGSQWITLFLRFVIGWLRLASVNPLAHERPDK